MAENQDWLGSAPAQVPAAALPQLRVPQRVSVDREPSRTRTATSSITQTPTPPASPPVSISAASASTASRTTAAGSSPPTSSASLKLAASDDIDSDLDPRPSSPTWSRHHSQSSAVRRRAASPLSSSSRGLVADAGPPTRRQHHHYHHEGARSIPAVPGGTIDRTNRSSTVFLARPIPPRSSSATGGGIWLESPGSSGPPSPTDSHHPLGNDPPAAAGAPARRPERSPADSTKGFSLGRGAEIKYASFIFDTDGSLAEPLAAISSQSRSQAQAPDALPCSPATAFSASPSSTLKVGDRSPESPQDDLRTARTKPGDHSAAAASTISGLAIGVGQSASASFVQGSNTNSAASRPAERSILRRSEGDSAPPPRQRSASPETSRLSFSTRGDRRSHPSPHSMSSAPPSASYPPAATAASYAYNSTPPIIDHHQHSRATLSPTEPSSRLRKSSSSRSNERTLDAFLGTGEFAPKKSKKGRGSNAGDESNEGASGDKKKAKMRDFLGFGGSGRKQSTSPVPPALALDQPPPLPPMPPPFDRAPGGGGGGGGPQPGRSHISHVERDEEDLCPVCLEPLAMRMRGEKPHVNPVCGHRLHSSCFEAVYGPVSRAKEKSSSLGLCGVCRRDMKIGDESDGPGKSGKTKFAAMAGIPGRDGGASPFDAHKLRSISRRTLLDAQGAGQSLHNPEEDDEIILDGRLSGHSTPRRDLRHRGSADTLQANRSAEGSMSGRGRAGSFGHHSRPKSRMDGNHQEHELAQPKISVIAEHTTLARSVDPKQKQNVTCLVTVEMPSKYPGTQPFDPSRATVPAPMPPPNKPPPQWPSTVFPQPRAPSSVGTSVDRSPTLEQRPHSPTSSGRTSPTMDEPRSGLPRHGPLQTVVDDLRARMADWKGHDPETFGVLQLYDLLSVRKTHQAREFFLYLFEETLLCVDEAPRQPNGAPLTSASDKPELRLRGRVYVRHIHHVEETSPSPSDLQLTVEMEQKELEAFVICFKERSSLEVWRFKIQQLVERQRRHRNDANSTGAGGADAGLGRRPRASIMSGRTDTTRHTGSSDGDHSISAFTNHTRTTMTTAPPLSAVGEESEAEYAMSKLAIQPMAQSRDVYQHHSASSSIASSLTTHRELPPVDLMLIVSVPQQSNVAPTSYTLKLRLIRQSLDFILHSVGSRSRISIVTYSVGEGARSQLRKTPFLSVGRDEGRERLQTAIGEIGDATLSSGKEFGLIDHAEDKVSVVTAVNLALDIVLQRKQKNPLAGILLVNDSRDFSSKPQMSLVMARAEAANVPIHTIGWGKSHDPSSLWQLSHHTAGTYTFAPDWYSLKDCMAGCIGGMLSVAITNVRIHVSVPERRWFRIRKVAGIHSVILSSDGKDADIDLGELRHGEKRELLVEMEMLPVPQTPDPNRQRGPAVSTATDEFFYKRTGINPMNLDDMGDSFYDAEFDDLIDEVPLFEVDASYRDPIVAKNVSRLPYPVLLTVTVTPPNAPGQRSPPGSGDPAIVRRRIEVLASDAMTRALLLVSRNNHLQAQRLLSETRRIILALMGNYAPGYTSRSPQHRRIETRASNLAYAVLAACAEDVATVQQGIESGRTFDQMEKNFAAQQAVVLREQRAWTARTATERVFWRADHSVYLAHQSARWLGTSTDS